MTTENNIQLMDEDSSESIIINKTFVITINDSLSMKIEVMVILYRKDEEDFIIDVVEISDCIWINFMDTYITDNKKIVEFIENIDKTSGIDLYKTIGLILDEYFKQFTIEEILNQIGLKKCTNCS